MSKHITTHLFFHMDSGGSKQKDSGTTSSSAPRKAKKSSNLSSGYEIDTNPPLPTESGDYYDYYTNYGIPDYYGPMSPTSPPFLCGRDDLYNYYDYRCRFSLSFFPIIVSNSYFRNNEYDYYPNPNEADYGDGGGGGYGNANHYDRAYTDRPHNAANPSTSAMIPHGYGSGSGHIPYPHHLQPPLISPPIQPPRASSPLSPFPPDLWSAYRSDSQGLSAISHKLHRITFVEACIFQPPDLPSPVRPLPSSAGATTAQPPPPPPSSLPLHSASGQAPGSVPPVRPPVPVLAQGERSPTSTGGTQYYQEWTSKHMRHLCSRFEKPSQQQLLMNVERKSKYPFIILCTPERGANPALSKSSSTSSGKARAAPVYRREISQHSAYSLEEEDEEEDEEAHWITQKQRDSINNHYLPPPPPPLLMPHIWPEIRYIDGLYTVCASIIRPGSGVADDFDESLYLGQDTTTMANTGPYAEQANYSGNMHDYQYNPHEKHISFQDSISQHSAHTGGSGGSGKGSKEKSPRPAGYIVSAFATFPGEDSERLEKNWLLWTGKLKISIQINPS